MHRIGKKKKESKNGKNDISGEELSFELTSLSFHFTKNMDPENAIKYLYTNDLNEIHAKESIALRILLTLPIIVASATKNYLRSTMG